MKRLLAIFTLLLLAQSCTKETDVSQGSEMSIETVSFTASVVDMSQTKATLINSWSGDEEVALFVGEALYLYTIAEDGTMSGEDIIVAQDESITYTAFYPYTENLTTIEEYEALCVTGCEVDYLKATTTTSGNSVELQFTHSLAALTFTILIEGAVSDLAISLVLDGTATNLELDSNISSIASRVVANYFVVDGTDISSAYIKVGYSGSTTFHFIARDDTNTLVAGSQYPFSYTIGDIAIGSGVDGDPYIVYFADDMRKVGTGTDGWELSSYYKLAQDIDLEDVEFTAIGDYSSPFTGNFDGDGHVISGLYINQPNSDYQGLFGYVKGGSISNLGVSGSVTGQKYVAGIVGYTDDAYVSNCYNACSVEGTQCVGGIVGFAGYYSVSDCYNTGRITGTGESSNIGGVVGACYRSLSGCYNIGLVEGVEYVGGVAGYYYEYSASVSQCYYDSNVVTSVTGAVDSADNGTNYCGLTTEMMKGSAETEGTLLYYFSNRSSWTADTENINNGYPILTWQTSNN